MKYTEYDFDRYGVSGTSTVRGDEVIRTFQTAEVASMYAGILNRDLRNNGSTVSYGASFGFAGIGVTGTLNTSWEFRIASRQVVVINQSGAIEKLDLPWIVWTWLKLSAAGKLARTIWYGQRG